MKSIVTVKEEKQFYKRFYFLLPIYTALLFFAITYIFYNIVSIIIHGMGFYWNTTFMVIALVLGFLEGLSTMLLNIRLIKKRNNLFYKSKDTFVPVVYEKSTFNSVKGFVMISKDTVRFQLYDLFEKKTMLTEDFADTSLSIVREKNKPLKMIFTLIPEVNILHLKSPIGEYKLIIPCIPNIVHRLETHAIFGKKRS